MSTLFQRKRTWFVRCYVPKELQALVGAKEVVRSLKTTDYAQAKLKRPAVEASIVASVQQSAQQQKMNAFAADAAAALNRHGYMPKVPLNFDLALELLAALQAIAEHAFWVRQNAPEKGIDAETLRLARQTADRLLAADPAKATEASASMDGVPINLYPRPLDGRFGSDIAKSIRAELDRHQVSIGLTLEQVVDRYCQSKSNIRVKTANQTRFAGRAYTALIGNVIAEDVTPDDALRFRDIRARLTAHPSAKVPLSEQLDKAPLCTLKTVKRDVNCLSAVFGWANRNKMVKSNPFFGISFDLPKRSTAKRFTRSDAIAIFRYLIANPPKNARKLMAYRIITLLAITGARLDEIALLKKRSICFEGERAYFNLDQSMVLKTVGSERRIPVHHDAKDWVVRMIDDIETEELFPNLPKDKDGKKSGAASKLCIAVIKRAVPDGTVHAFRHFFKDAMRDAGVPRDVADAIQGHADGSVSGGYGHGFSLTRLAAEMNKVDVAFAAPVLSAAKASLGR